MAYELSATRMLAMERKPMRGQFVRRTWRHDPAIYAPPRYRRACEYEAFIPEALEAFDAPLGTDLSGVISEAERAVLGLNAQAHPGLAPLARLLLRTESIASSKLEGMQVSVRDLARAEARVETGGRAGPTAQEILANIDAMELAVAEASIQGVTTIEDLVAIHRALMATAPNARMAGLIRTEQNWIGGNDHNPCGADYVSPPPEDVPWLLQDLCVAVNEEHLPPLVQAALVHAQFETIHPFMDGNGRTGRALIHVVLRRRGLTPAYVPPLSVVLAGNKPQYIEGLTRFREGDVEGWLETFAVAAAKAADLAGQYLSRVLQLQDQWRDSLRAAVRPRADAAAWRVIDVLVAHPIITVPVAVAATGRAKATINQALGQLQEAGVLVPLTERERNRSWEAVGLLDLMGGLEVGRVPPG